MMVLVMCVTTALKIPTHSRRTLIAMAVLMLVTIAQRCQIPPSLILTMMVWEMTVTKILTVIGMVLR